MTRIDSPSILLLLLLLLPQTVFSQTTTTTTKPTLNEPFQTSFQNLPHIPCVSLFHRNGRIGCGTYSRDTMTGRLLHWSSVVFKSGDDDETTTPGIVAVPPYVAVMDEWEYSNENVEYIISYGEAVDELEGRTKDDEKSLRGILVLKSDDYDGNLIQSPAPQSPRGYGTPSSSSSSSNGANSYSWNPNGDALVLRNMYGIPTAYIESISVSTYLKEVANDQGDEVWKSRLKNQKVRDGDFMPTIVAEFNYYMGADNNNDDGAEMTSESCLSWKDTDGTWSPKCLPLGGNSIWATVGTPEELSSSNDERRRRRRLDGNANDDDNNKAKPIILMSTSIDTTSMFHDASHGANTAVSNILSLLLSAKILGSSLSDSDFDALPYGIAFAFFQGESYGYLGSRLFFKDVILGFECDENRLVNAVAKDVNGTTMACLNPLRTNLDFTNLGEIVGVIAVDQVGVLSQDNTLYVHADQENGGISQFLANVLLQMGSDDYAIAASSVAAADDDNGAYPLPPTPLNSFIRGGGGGGAVLTGYDDTFTKTSLYQSHLDDNSTRAIDLEAITTSATVLARSALAAAYVGDDDDADYEGAAEYAKNVISEDFDEDTREFLEELSHCLLQDGNCDLILKYANVERKNDADRTGIDLGLGDTFMITEGGPGYYVGVYNANSGQGFVQVDRRRYGAYTGDATYGDDHSDTFLLRPGLLEMAIHGFLNDFLGRSSSSSSSSQEDENQDENQDHDEVSCNSIKDCANVPYCSSSTNDFAVCSGSKVCVCSRARYHPAVDENIIPSPNNFTGWFLLNDDDDANTAIYTEPYWSYMVGVKVYRDAGDMAGAWALGVGFFVWIVSVGSVFYMRKKLKEKLL